MIASSFRSLFHFSNLFSHTFCDSSFRYWEKEEKKSDGSTLKHLLSKNYAVDDKASSFAKFTDAAIFLRVRTGKELALHNARPRTL